MNVSSNLTLNTSISHLNSVFLLYQQMKRLGYHITSVMPSSSSSCMPPFLIFYLILKYLFILLTAQPLSIVFLQYIKLVEWYKAKSSYATLSVNMSSNLTLNTSISHLNSVFLLYQQMKRLGYHITSVMPSSSSSCMPPFLIFYLILKYLFILLTAQPLSIVFLQYIKLVEWYKAKSSYVTLSVNMSSNLTLNT